MVFNELVWSIRSKVRSNLMQNAVFKYSYISPSESFPPSCKLLIEHLEKILQDYEIISKFINFSDDYGMKDQRNGSYYLHAFCCGVSSVLSEFEAVLCEIESTYLNETNFISISVINKLEFFVPILSNIKTAIEKITEGKFRGCAILNLCDHFINCGCPVLKNVFEKIEYFCLKPFYMQTKIWLTKAVLKDPYNEYFISMDDSFLQESQTLHTGIIESYTSISSEDTHSTVHKLNADNLPSLIPLSVATKILFIGESLIMCQHNKVELGDFKDQTLRICEINENNVLSKFTEIESLEKFNLRNFSFLIDDVWIGLNRYVRKAAEEIGNVNSQLSRMWEIYLLGRGELFQEFLTKGSSLLNADVSTIDNENLNIVLRDSLYYVYLSENSDISDQFYFKLPPRRGLKKGLLIWSVMRLNCKVKWPLHYLFSAKVMDTYNILFCFLLRLKKAQIDLNATWKNTNKIKNRSLRMELIEIRIQLLSIVGNLQNYCFTNVIANEMNALNLSIQKIDMFTDLQKALHIFLTNIMNRLFLFSTDINNSGPLVEHSSPDSDSMNNVSKKVNNCFLTIFKLCDEFSSLIESDGYAMDKFSHLNGNLNTTLKKLFSILQKIDENYHDENNSKAYLFNLMMCLDYNGFFQHKFNLKYN